MSTPFPQPTSLLAPSFALSQCTPQDLPALAESYLASFGADRGFTHWFSPDHDAMLAWARRRFESKMASRRVRYFKIVDHSRGGDRDGKQQGGEEDEDGKMGSLVAWTRWTVPEATERKGVFGSWVGDGDDGHLVPAASAASVGGIIEAPEGANPALLKNLFDKLAVMGEKWGSDEMLELSVLCTSPDYRKRGAARALMTPLLAIADVEGLSTYVESTPMARPVYERFGFRAVDAIKFEVGRMGLPGPDDPEEMYELTVMIREPQTAPRV